MKKQKKTKLKVSRSVLLRIKVTKTGKLMRRRGFNRHLKHKKRKSTNRSLDRPVEIKGFYAVKLRKILGI